MAKTSWEIRGGGGAGGGVYPAAWGWGRQNLREKQWTWEAGQEPPQDSTRDPFQLQMRGARGLSSLRAFTPSAEVARGLGTQSPVPGVEMLVIPGLLALRKEVLGGGVRLDASRQGRGAAQGSRPGDSNHGPPPRPRTHSRRRSAAPGRRARAAAGRGRGAAGHVRRPWRSRGQLCPPPARAEGPPRGAAPGSASQGPPRPPARVARPRRYRETTPGGGSGRGDGPAV